MPAFILKRLLQALPVLLIVITASFFMVRLAPGDPFSQERALPVEVMKGLRTYYKLDQPLVTQYIEYLKNIAQGDFGPSFKYSGRTVTEIIGAGLPVTFELGAYALLIALLVGISSGVIASLRPNTWQDYVPMSLAMIGICLPSYVLGPLLVLIVGIWLEWLPVSGWGYIPGDKILPSVTMGFVYAAYISRLARGGMLEILSQDFIRTARAKGVSESMIVLRHALRGGMQPVISFMGPALAGLLGGSFVVETIFQIPGLGRYYVQAAFNRDYTLILGMTIFFAVLIVVFNLLADIVAAWMNPRLRSGKSAGG
ncbi:MAG: ABC transporter permease subunit [Gammaproteobacteria bacterium]|nr:MAG: ABC transporter permease subunit [Gammaproteobacteria bacterium]